jgi:uncharacterized protein YyaL (SSP411 family)
LATLNRLADQPSPYLRQHAGNPVDWWPWSDEAFADARRRDVPVLISVGYSACHWCHVMAHESFEDDEVAQLLNAHFLAIKVDREERPDVDAVYMEAVQLVNGSGGWPMTVLALPDGRPFWAGTYLRKAAFVRLLSQVAELWDGKRSSLEDDAARLSEAVRNGAALPGPAPTAGPALPQGLDAPGPGTVDDLAWPGALAGPDGSEDALARAAKALMARSDPEWGGFGNAPKFPQPGSLDVLAQYYWRSAEPIALGTLCRALDAMSSGGIYDHLAGGFARYSTDRYWLVPHFEKMLYDNALLVRAYTRTWQLTGSQRYRQVVEETVGYLLRPPIRLSVGAWASAEDADSEGEEGRFYVWSSEEVDSVGGAAVADWYGVTEAGNWEGRNVLWRPGIGDLERPPDVEEARARLAERRQGRPRPGLDAKVLTEWNAMAISALAYAGRALDRPSWVAAAAETADVLLSELRGADGRWRRSWHPGMAGPRHLACSADYAWLVEAFTRLSEATGEARWISEARAAADALIDLFWDHEGGGFFTTGNDAEQLIARMKDIHDGAVPSANATAALALGRLGELTGAPGYEDVARRTVDALGPALAVSPASFAATAVAADYLSGPRRQVVVSSSDPALVRPVWARYLPSTVLAWGEPYAAPLWEGRDDDAAAGLAFVCEGYTCLLPVRQADQVAALLVPPVPSTFRAR